MSDASLGQIDAVKLQKFKAAFRDIKTWRRTVDKVASKANATAVEMKIEPGVKNLQRA